MKLSYFAFLLFLVSRAECQTGLEISANGLDSIKIGMKKIEVEKVLRATLQPYTASTSGINDPDSVVTTWGCKNCTKKYICKYKTVTLLLTFFRYTLYKQTDYELAAISSAPPSSLIHTKAGIKVGISKKEFLAICRNNNYRYNEMPIDDNSNAYVFSERQHGKSAKVLMAKFSNNSLVDLLVINMIGD